MFSGGIDSTYTAEKLSPLFDKIILNTYKTPGMKNVKASKKSFQQIKKKHGEKVIHNIIDISNFTNSIRRGILECIADNFKYRFFYSWCLGCKLSMHLYTINFCTQNNIKFVVDGSNYYDLHALEQKTKIKQFFEKIYKDNSITFIAPFYLEKNVVVSKGFVKKILKHLRILQDNQKIRLNYLHKKGINMGAGILGQHRTIQPSCTISLFFNIPRLFFKFFLKHEEKKGLAFLKQKLLNFNTTQKGHIYDFNNNTCS